MSKRAHPDNAHMDDVERRARFIKEQETKQAAYAASRKAWRDSLELHDVRKESES